jgi:hypothetical protein
MSAAFANGSPAGNTACGLITVVIMSAAAAMVMIVVMMFVLMFVRMIMSVIMSAATGGIMLMFFVSFAHF